MVKFREFITSSGTLVLGGKSAENNEELIGQVDSNEVVLHTKNPGSPFVNIKVNASIEDIKEAAVFCAKYSQDWKKSNKKHDVVVHIFKGKDINKEKSMKLGTFGVKKFKEIKVKKQDIEVFRLKEDNSNESQ